MRVSKVHIEKPQPRAGLFILRLFYVMQGTNGEGGQRLPGHKVDEFARTRPLMIVLSILMLISCSRNRSDNEFDVQLALLPLKTGGVWGYVNQQGIVKIKPQFQSASEFCNGYAVVKADKKYGLIAPTGQFTVQPTFDDMLPANSEDLVAVCMGDCSCDSNNAR